MEFIKQLKFDSNGLIPAIIQDYRNGEVLMLGYMNEEALRRTIQDKKVCFWSRSRRRLWLKGESSGHIQVVKEVYFDCDGDTLLIKVDQKGGACHEGYRSCFFRKVAEDGGFRIVGERVFDPDRVYA
jgi:phosphoribosyl-AMP cyclohydrolase